MLDLRFLERLVEVLESERFLRLDFGEGVLLGDVSVFRGDPRLILNGLEDNFFPPTATTWQTTAFTPKRFK